MSLRNLSLHFLSKLFDVGSADNQGELDILITPARREPHTWANNNMLWTKMPESASATACVL